MFFGPSDRSRSHNPADHMHDDRRAHHPDLTRLQGWRSMQSEADLPEGRWDEERRWALRMGLTGADSIEDKSIPTCARGELPHYAGINTFLNAPYAEDVSGFSQAKLSAGARQINERPRKTLQYQTPAEKFEACVATTR